MQKRRICELEVPALDLVLRAEMPVTADYVSRQLGVSWDTARALLLGLSCRGKLKATKTMKSWIFEPAPENERLIDSGESEHERH